MTRVNPTAMRLFMMGITLVTFCCSAFTVGCVLCAPTLTAATDALAGGWFVTGGIVLALGLVATPFSRWLERNHGRSMLVPLDAICPGCGSPKEPLIVNVGRMQAWLNCPYKCGGAMAARQRKLQVR